MDTDLGAAGRDEFDLDIRTGTAASGAQAVPDTAPTFRCSICLATGCANTCPPTCPATCGGATCGTRQTRCGQDTCADTCTCQTRCGQDTCHTCQTDCQQQTCVTCNTRCEQHTCPTFHTCDTCGHVCNTRNC